MTYTKTRTMTTSLLGPTAGELQDFLAGLPANTRIRVEKDNGYNQLDPGSLTFSATEDTGQQQRRGTSSGSRTSTDWNGTWETTR